MMMGSCRASPSDPLRLNDYCLQRTPSAVSGTGTGPVLLWLDLADGFLTISHGGWWSEREPKLVKSGFHVFSRGVGIRGQSILTSRYLAVHPHQVPSHLGYAKTSEAPSGAESNTSRVSSRRRVLRPGSSSILQGHLTPQKRKGRKEEITKRVGTN